MAPEAKASGTRAEIAQHEERPCELSERPEPECHRTRRWRPKSTLPAVPASTNAELRAAAVVAAQASVV